MHLSGRRPSFFRELNSRCFVSKHSHRLNLVSQFQLVAPGIDPIPFRQVDHAAALTLSLNTPWPPVRNGLTGELTITPAGISCIFPPRAMKSAVCRSISFLNACRSAGVILRLPPPPDTL